MTFATARQGGFRRPSVAENAGGMEAMDHQREALDEIVSRARAYFRGDWRDLPIQPRWASLMVGSTGTGKTAVAAMAAEALSGTIPVSRTGIASAAAASLTDAIPVSLIRVSGPNWKPVGASNRGTRETISCIAEHVARNDKTILCIDEICKLLITNDSGWQGYVRAECFEILDGRWPTGLTLSETEDDDAPAITIEALTTKLRETVFVLGIATFQGWHDGAGSRRNIGFGAETDPANDELSADIIAGMLPREFSNRFNSGIICIPELTGADYARIARETADKLPIRMQQAFRAEVAKRIGPAIAAKKGVRYLEEAMMEVLKNLPPAPAPVIAEFIDCGFFDTLDLEPCTF